MSTTVIADSKAQTQEETAGQDSIQEISGLVDDIDEVIISTELTVARNGILPDIKGIEALKDGIMLGNVERTVDDMARIITNMESQLQRYLSMNAALEKDLNDSKEIIANLRAEKDSALEKITALETEMPSKRELQVEVDLMVEERTSVQNQIHAMNQKFLQTQGALDEYRKQITRLERDKADAVAEVNFLESRANAAKEQNNAFKDQIALLKKEKNAYQQKIIDLQEECQRELEQKYVLTRDLKVAKERVAELHREITDTKLNAKKSFYENVDKIRKG